MSKGQFCVYLSKDLNKKIKSFIYDSKIFNKNQLDNLFDVLPDNYLEIMMSVLLTNYRRPLDINNSIDKSIIKDYIINKYNELNNKETEDDSDIDYYTTGEVVSNEEVESLKLNNAGVFSSFIGNVNENLIKFRRAVFENAKQQGIEITDKKDSEFYKFITSLSDSIIKKLMKEGKIITIRPNENLSTNMAVLVNGDVITITYNPLLVVRDADKFDAIISHELLHTVTAAAVNNTQHNIANEEELQFTQEIFDIIKDLALNKEFYWDMNIDISSFKGKYKYIKEFIANVMANEELREHLSNIKYQLNNPDIAEEEKSSILSKVFKSIYNYIKSFYSKDTEKDLDLSYLEKLTSIIQSHIDTQPSDAFSTSSRYTEGTISRVKTPIKELYKGKLIFALSGTGKSRVADNINVIDGDLILGDILGVDSDFIGITFNQLSNSDKILFSNEYHKKIDTLIKQGKTVLTASLSLLDKADVIIYNKSVEESINRVSNTDRQGSNNIINSSYYESSIKKIKEYLESTNKESILLSENEYLSDVLLTDPTVLLPRTKAKELTITEVCKTFLSNFGITINTLQTYNNDLPLFDALNRVVNVSSEEELSEATGYAVAFMMQWTPEVKELVSLLHAEGKSVRRAFKRKGHVQMTMSDKTYKILDKSNYLKEIGKDIANELNKLHNKENVNTKDNWLLKIWKVISSFFDIMHPQAKEDLRRLSSYTFIIAQAINRNLKNVVSPISSKPNTITEKIEDLPSLVEVDRALKENPYEESIISTLQKENIYLAGSTSMAVLGLVLRPKENPLHDLDFSASNKTKEDLDSILNKYYPNNTFIRTIPGDEGNTYTYLVLDRPFESKRDIPGVAVESLYDKNTGEKLGSWVGSDLVLEEGVHGKFLDFFTKQEKFPPVTKTINGKLYTFSNAKEALEAKVTWLRPKDIWDFNNYIPNDFEEDSSNLDRYTEGKVGNASSVKFSWAKLNNDNYEVSSKGDKRFSALNATFKKGTTIEGVDVGGRTIEDVYQNIIKKSGKNQPPSKDSKLYNPKLKTKEEKEDFSYYEGYLPLWQEWAKQNPELIEELREKVKGRTLTDLYANTRVSQARALADILNNGTSSKNASIATKNYKKETPSENPNTNFVFTDNALAYTALHSVEGIDKSLLISPKDGVKLNVTAYNNLAGIRMKDDTTANSNAYGLVVKKNQLDNEGKFIHQEGTFKDTDEDFKLFVALNEHMFDRLEASGNKEVVFPSNIASVRAALPKRFAEWLLKLLKDRYRLDYNLEEHKKNKNEKYNYEGWSLTASSSITPKSKEVETPKKTSSVKTGKTREEKKKEREKAEEKAKKSALESYNKEAPKLNLLVDKSKLDSVLINNIPNLALRIALEKAVYHLFNNYWDSLLQRVKEDRKTTLDDNLAKIYDYILKGSLEELKLKLLNSLSYVKLELKNGEYVDTVMNPIKYMMSTILDDIRYFASVTSLLTKTNSRGELVQETELNIEAANQLINYYLVLLDAKGNIQYDNNGVPIFKRNTPFGESFYLRYGTNNQYLKLDLKTAALDFVKTLSTLIKPIADEETFNAVFIKSLRLLKHNDNIKINFLNKGSSTKEDQSNLNEPEEEDRSGLNLVKFKTLEPSKRMSLRVRSLLSKTPRYLNDKILFNTLGLVEYLTPDVAYYLLVDKFATIRNELDYNNLLNSLSEEYPWFLFIKEKIDLDEIFRNDFYSAFRNVFNRYAIINNRGKISYLNGEAALDILIDDLQSTYESGLLLNEFSIYNSDTNPNIENIEKFRNSVLQGVLKNFSQNFTNLKKIKENKSSLTNDTPTQIATLLKLLLVLSDYKLNEGTYLFKSTISLKSILNTFGVSTDKLDLSHLHISLDEVIAFINNQESFKNSPIDIKTLSDIIINNDNESDKIEALSNFIIDKDLSNIFIDYFTQSGIENKINKLSTMLNAMSIIVGKNTGFVNANTNLVQSFYKLYLRILSPLKDTTEIYGTTTFLFDNKSRPSYSTPSYASDILSHLNTINNQEDLDKFRVWVEQEFTLYDFYKDSKGECNHLWIKTLLDFIGPKGQEKSILDIKEFARNFDSTEILGVGGSDSTKNSVGKVDTLVLLKSLIPAAFNARSNNSDYNFGYFKNPLYSDKDVLVLFKAPMFRGKGFKDKVINQLYKVWQAEHNRIKFYLDRLKFKNKNNSIEGLEKTGDKYHFFPEFNTESFFTNLPVDENDREDYVKEQISKLLEDKFKEFYQVVYSDQNAKEIQDIIEGNLSKETGVNDELEFTFEDDSTEESEEAAQERKNLEDQRIRNMYEEFYYNDFMNYIESIRLFQGDPALYGNSTALVKRGALSHVFGLRGYFIDEQGNPITEKCIYIEDYYADSNSMANVMALLRLDTKVFSSIEQGMIEGLIRKTANYYKDICTTDGLSFRTLASIKKILKGFGKLTPEIEESLNNIEAGNIKAEDLIKIINNLKPFLYSSESRKLKAGTEELSWERTEKVITLHKNSEYALSALYSILNTALNKSNALKGLLSFMEKNDIDVAHFKSVVKVGANNLFDLNDVYNSKLNTILESKPYIYDDKENKLYLELPLKLGNKKENIKIEVPSDIQKESFSEIYKYIRESLKINPKKDINLKLSELDLKQKIYNAFLSLYGLESLSEKEVVSILNGQLNTDDEGNTSTIPNLNKIHTFKLQDYVLVLPVDDHYLDHEAIFGSLLRNIVPANLPDNFTCTLRIKGKDVLLNKELTVLLYNTLITDLLLDSYNTELRRKFTSIEEFKKYIDDLIASNDKYGEDIYNALQLDETGTDFRMPLTAPNLSNKIDEIILSAAKNAIQRQKIKGGNIVLVSNFGFTNKLRTETETVEIINDQGKKEKRKRIKYIPCYAPMSMMLIYLDYLEEENDEKGNVWYTIDFQKLKDDGNIDPKFLNMIGYRIPTENNYSIMPIRIVGILPQSMGSSIMLPQDIITMSGTDFK